MTSAGVTNAADIEREITAFAQEPNGGLVVAPAPSTFDRRDLIIALAERWRLPAIYSYRFNVKSGGLVSYGYEGIDNFSRRLPSRPHSAWSEARWTSAAVAEQISVGDQPEGRKSYRTFNSSCFSFARRRGDRIDMRRREFIKAIAGSRITLPLAAKAQQPAIPLIEFLSSTSENTAVEQQRKFHSGLGEAGFVQGKNVAIEYHWADGQYDRLPAMAADLVRRPVSLIVAQGPPAALAARAATTTIPIVFVVGFDPIAGGLVDSLNRPGGNATGMTLLTGPLGQKRIEQLRELVPKAAVVAMLANPVSPDAVPEIRDVQIAAQANSLELKMYNASTRAELDAAFSAIAAQRPDALLVGSDPFYVVRRDDFVAFAARYKIPRSIRSASSLMPAD